MSKASSVQWPVSRNSLANDFNQPEASASP